MTRIAGTQPVRQRRPRKPDYAYRRHVASLPCLVCKKTGNVQAAHIRHGHEGGIGYKPDDALCIPLCSVSGCAAHAAFDTNQERYAKQIIHIEIDNLKEQARENYEAWKQENSPDDGKHMD